MPMQQIGMNFKNCWYTFYFYIFLVKFSHSYRDDDDDNKDEDDDQIFDTVSDLRYYKKSKII